MSAPDNCGHDEFDIDGLLAEHPGLDRALTVPLKCRTGQDPDEARRDAQRDLLNVYREAAGESATVTGACALLRRHPPSVEDWPGVTCLMVRIAWRQVTDPLAPTATIAQVAVELPAPTRAAQEHYPAPLDCLPLLLREFVHTTAAFAQVPEEMTLFAALASVSFATAGRILIDIHGHDEPLALYLMQRALPSERKSGALSVAAINQLAAAVARYWDDRKEEQEQLAVQIEILTARIKNLKTALARPNANEEDQGELDLARARLDGLQEEIIPFPVWDVSDATTEGLETLMANTRGVAASFADEAALLQTINGKYSKDGKASLGSLNSAWSRRSISVQRASVTRHVPEPHLVLCQLIQPEPFATLMSKLGTGADGFLSRWLYSEPAPHGQRAPRGARLEHGTVERWRKTLHSLLERCWGKRGTEALTLTRQAWASYDEVFAAIETERLAEREENGPYAEWLGKAPNGHILRIAALFELIEDSNAIEISAASVNRAVQLYQWLRLEARQALGIASGDALAPDVERKALTWIAAYRTRTKATHVLARDLARGPRMFREMRREELEAILTELERAGWLTHCAEPPIAEATGQLRSDAQAWWEIRPDFESTWKP